MILLANGSEKARFSSEFDQMFRARALVFRDRLKWDVRVRDGWETDEFDDENPLYLLSIDETSGRVRGSLRLLPTTGPHMMRAVFGRYFSADALLESPLIWECTRFTVHPSGNAADPEQANISNELLLGICEVGLRAGVAQITGLFDRRMIRIYRRIGWSPAIIATSDRLGPEPVSVGLWDVCETALERMRARIGRPSSVLGPLEAGERRFVA